MKVEKREEAGQGGGAAAGRGGGEGGLERPCTLSGEMGVRRGVVVVVGAEDTGGGREAGQGGRVGGQGKGDGR